MIDTDKYEGHTQGHWATTTRKGTWVVYTQDNGDVATMNDYEDAKLIADAPKLLAEVKRWKKEYNTVRGWFLDIDNYMMEHHYDMWQEIRIEIGLDEGEEE